MMAASLAAATLAAAMLASAAAWAAEKPETPTLAGLTVHNRGIGGQNSRQGRARFEKDVVAAKPNYVFIYFGLNDALNERALVPLEDYVKNLRWMIDRSRQAGIVPVIATIHPVGEEALLKRHKRETYGSEGPNGRVDRYNAAIRKLVKDQGVALADFANVVGKDGKAAAPAAQEESARPTLVSSDGVHLTPAGNRALAQCFLAAVAGKLRGGQTIVCLGDSVTYGAGNRGAGTAEGDTYPAMLRGLPIAK
jgi:acyl-CoA thioesterase-1